MSEKCHNNNNYDNSLTSRRTDGGKKLNQPRFNFGRKNKHHFPCLSQLMYAFNSNLNLNWLQLRKSDQKIHHVHARRHVDWLVQ